MSALILVLSRYHNVYSTSGEVLVTRIIVVVVVEDENTLQSFSCAMESYWRVKSTAYNNAT